MKHLEIWILTIFHDLKELLLILLGVMVFSDKMMRYGLLYYDLERADVNGDVDEKKMAMSR